MLPALHQPSLDTNEVKKYEADVRSSWVWDELTRVRNFKPVTGQALIRVYLLRRLLPDPYVEYVGVACRA